MIHSKPYVPTIKKVADLKSAALLELLIHYTSKNESDFLAYTEVWLEIVFSSAKPAKDTLLSPNTFSDDEFEKLVNIGLDVKKINKTLMSFILENTKKYQKYVSFAILIAYMRANDADILKEDNVAVSTWLVKESIVSNEIDISDFDKILGLLGEKSLSLLSYETYQQLKKIAVQLNRTDYIRCFKQFSSLLSSNRLDIAENGFFAINYSIDNYYIYINQAHLWS